MPGTFMKLGLLIGPRGATQKQLQESSGAKIIIRGRGAQKDGAPLSGHPDDEDELHVCIEGTDEAIEKALKEIQPLFCNPEEAMKLKQEQLKNLAQINGAPLSSSGFGSSNAEIYGGNAKVVGSVMLGGGGGGGDDYQIELRVPNPMVGLVIGKGGEQIQRMQSQTGVHLQIAREQDMLPGETLRSILIKGKPGAVTECKRMIDEIINNRQQQSGGGSTGLGQQKTNNQRELDHAFIIKVKVPNNKVGIIIGKGGITVKMIMERTRAQVQIPSNPDEDNPNVRTLSIGGDTKESVENAQAEITIALQQSALALGGPPGGGGSLMVNSGLGVSQGLSQFLAQQPSQLSQSGTSFVYVPDDKVGVIIGKGGVTIKELQLRLKVKISIPQAADSGSNPPVRTCR